MTDYSSSWSGGGVMLLLLLSQQRGDHSKDFLNCNPKS